MVAPWGVNRWRRLVDLRRTPSTFPTSEITLGTLVRDAIAHSPLGGLLFPSSQDLARFVNPTFFQASPQKTGSFDDCFTSSGLARASFKNPATGKWMQNASEFWDGAADMLLEVHDAENNGASLPLLAVTWMNESSFHMRGPHQTNNSADTDTWDYGPFQLNKNWTNWAADIYLKTGGKRGFSKAGLSDADIYGTGTDANFGFNGDPKANGQIASRVLSRGVGGATDRQKAMNFTKVPSRPDRGISYDNFAPLFQKFFDCYRGGDSQGVWK